VPTSSTSLRCVALRRSVPAVDRSEAADTDELLS
jgi:hypothetical protein